MPALGKLEAKIEVFVSPDQLFIQLGEPVEGDVPERVVELRGTEQGR
jgi:hypothetical protein